MYRKIAELVEGAVSAESVTDYCREIADRDRWFSYKHMYMTAEYLADQMRQLGLEGGEVVDVPATGDWASGDPPGGSRPQWPPPARGSRRRPGSPRSAGWPSPRPYSMRNQFTPYGGTATGRSME